MKVDSQVANIIEYKKTKDNKILEKLLKQNEGLLISICTKKYKLYTRKHKSYGNIDWDDFLQTARISMWEALKTYDESKGKLSVYLYVSVSCGIKNFIKQTYFSHYMHQDFRKYHRRISILSREYLAETGLNQDIEKIVSQLKIKEPHKKHITKDWIITQYNNLFCIKSGFNDILYCSYCGFDTRLLGDEIFEYVKLNTSNRNYSIFKLRFKQDKTLNEIGLIYNLTKQNISVIINKILNSVKEYFSEHPRNVAKISS